MTARKKPTQDKSKATGSEFEDLLDSHLLKGTKHEEGGGTPDDYFEKDEEDPAASGPVAELDEPEASDLEFGVAQEGKTKFVFEIGGEKRNVAEVDLQSAAQSSRPKKEYHSSIHAEREPVPSSDGDRSGDPGPADEKDPGHSGDPVDYVDAEMASDFIIDTMDTVFSKALGMLSGDMKNNESEFRIDRDDRTRLTRSLTRIILKRQIKLTPELIFFGGLVIMYSVMTARALQIKSAKKETEKESAKSQTKESAGGSGTTAYNADQNYESDSISQIEDADIIEAVVVESVRSPFVKSV